MLVDFHTHLDQYDEKSLALAVDCIVQNKILTLSASCAIDSWRKNLEIAKRAPAFIIPTFGVHPSYCKNLPQNEGELSAFLEPYFSSSAIIGEIGLDFEWETEIPHETQETVFLCCLDHCHRNKKFAVIHTKGAEARICEILRDFPDAKPIIHWYDGDEKSFRTFCERGFYQTFGCEVRYSERIQRFLNMTPAELLLSETDNPTGEPWLCEKRGITNIDNSPLLIRRVVSDMAKVKNIKESEMEAILEANAQRILLEARGFTQK